MEVVFTEVIAALAVKLPKTIAVDNSNFFIVIVYKRLFFKDSTLSICVNRRFFTSNSDFNLVLFFIIYISFLQFHSGISIIQTCFYCCRNGIHFFILLLKLY